MRVPADALRPFNDYFATDSAYRTSDFRRRYRMSKTFFMRIHDRVLARNQYFVQKRDALGVLGLSSLQKMTTAMIILAYGCSADALDENLRLRDSTAG